MKQTIILLAFSLGVFGPNYLPVLPSALAMIVAVGVLSAIAIFIRGSWLLAFSVGIAFGGYQAQIFNHQLLPHSLDGKVFVIAGQISAAETRSDSVQRLELRIDEMRSEDGVLLERFPRTALVSWYGEQRLFSGSQILAEAKLRRPRGFQNPGLFDYQKWLVAEGFGVTGYLRNIRISEDPNPGIGTLRDPRQLLDHWRKDKISYLSDGADLQFPGVHIALSLGDGTHLRFDQWELFRDTGTVHLMVISGLHVGLLAAVGYFLGFAVGRCLSAVWSLNAVRVGVTCSLGLAFSYCALSGFGVPAVRALVMLAAFLVPKFFYLKTSRWWSLALSLAVISVFEPRAVLQAGFWLSFGAVFLLFLGFSGTGRNNFFLGLVRTQILFLIGFSGVLMWQGLPVPAASFFANIISVPVISLVIVPLEVLALVISELSESAGYAIWRLADQVLEFQVGYLEYLQSIRLPAYVRPSNWGPLQAVAAICGLLVCAVPGWSLRFLFALGVLPLFFPQQDTEYFLKVRVFDVGQGTSVLVEQPEFRLLYDTGPRFSDRFDSGADIIAPSLKQKHLDVIEKLVVSHPDSDHRGGLEGLLSEIKVDTLDVGKPLHISNASKNNPQQKLCRKGDSWRQESVTYRYLWPGPGADYSDNDSSCVLLIQAQGINILLPGDIGASVEQILMDELEQLAPVDLVVVPHHGSKTSSSTAFIRSIEPDLAIVSAGYRNQFNHPHPDIVERYRSQAVRLLNTADAGAIEVLWVSPDSAPKVTLTSNSKLFWWQK